MCGRPTCESWWATYPRPATVLCQRPGMRARAHDAHAISCAAPVLGCRDRTNVLARPWLRRCSSGSEADTLWPVMGRVPLTDWLRAAIVATKMAASLADHDSPSGSPKRRVPSTGAQGSPGGVGSLGGLSFGPRAVMDTQAPPTRPRAPVARALVLDRARGRSRTQGGRPAACAGPDQASRRALPGAASTDTSTPTRGGS